jgi:hypothetical protein
LQSTYSFSEKTTITNLLLPLLLSGSGIPGWHQSSLHIVIRRGGIFSNISIVVTRKKKHGSYSHATTLSLSLSVCLSFAIGLLAPVAEECVDISEQRAKCAVWRQEEDTCFNILCMIPVCKVCSFSRRRSRRKKNKERKI